MNREAFSINRMYNRLEDKVARGFSGAGRMNVSHSIVANVLPIVFLIEEELREVKEAERLRKWRKSMGYS